MGQRVGIIALLEESNTFLSQPTTASHFEQDLLLRGDAIRVRLADAHHEVGGFFAGLDDAGLEAVPLFAARAVPYGIIAAEAFDQLLAMMMDDLSAAGPLDGLLVAAHGATVSQRERDADGHWLSLLRERVGSDTPIISTLDLHANLSQRMIEACDATIAYRTNPHTDQRARGEEAAALLARILRGEVQPTQAAVRPPMAINIECQQTAMPPCLPLYQQANKMLEHPQVLSNSILLGFPYADVAEMGSATIVVTDGDQRLAQQLANELAESMWSRRGDFVRRLISVDEALDQALKLLSVEPAGAVCLLDMGDNVGGGSPGDSTYLAHQIHRRQIDRAVVCLFDPEVAAQAAKVGAGNRARLAVGGKTDDRHGDPLEMEFIVLSLHDGVFEEPEPRHGGFTTFNQGRTAVLRTDAGLTLVVNSRRTPPFSLGQLTSCGLDPASFQLLVAKGVVAPMAAYAPVCRHFIRVNTPGVTTADMIQLDYQHRRRPMFPFETQTEWQPRTV